MRVFFYLCVTHLLVALGVIAVSRDDPFGIAMSKLPAVAHLGLLLVAYFASLGVGIVIAMLLTRKYGLRQRIVPALYAFIGCMILTNSFSLVKTAIPLIAPFYADPVLAEVDRLLHFGFDPWQFTHLLSDYVTPDFVIWAYITVWLPFGLLMPVIIALVDPDPDRSARFALIYFLSWVVVGNVFAVLGSSVGPVFYDEIYGGDRFAGLMTALETSGLSASPMGGLQADLLNNYVQGGQTVGTGISAFPSMHVAIAMIVFLYLAECNWRLAPIGSAFLAVTLYLSVYSGFHYAIDGYFSILVVMAFWSILRRRDVVFASTATA